MNRTEKPDNNIWLKIAVLALLAIAAAIMARADSPYAGLATRELARKIKSETRPATATLAAINLREIASATLTDDKGLLLDIFSGEYAVPSQLTLVSVVSPSWWPEAYSGMADVAANPINFFPANAQVAAHKGDYPPGLPDKLTYDNSVWAAGTGTLAGIETNFYRPPRGNEGDFARILMYMAAVYDSELWMGRATAVYADGDWPLLTAYGRRQLMDWHRSDPVDNREKKRDEAISAAIGCGNPFVSDPALAEYLWGDKTGEKYDETPGEGSSEPDDSDDKPQRIAVKAIYRAGTDSRIDFYSPFVPDDAVWTLDGRTVTTDFINLGDISAGDHRLCFKSTGLSGAVKIKVIK